jgi:hypothetical protein
MAWQKSSHPLKQAVERKRRPGNRAPRVHRLRRTWAQAEAMDTGSSGSEASDIAEFLDDFGSSSDDGDLLPVPAPQQLPEPEPEPEPTEPEPAAPEPAAPTAPEPESRPLGALPDAGWPLLQLMYRSGARASVRPDPRPLRHPPVHMYQHALLLLLLLLLCHRRHRRTGAPVAAQTDAWRLLALHGCPGPVLRPCAAGTSGQTLPTARWLHKYVRARLHQPPCYGLPVSESAALRAGSQREWSRHWLRLAMQNKWRCTNHYSPCSSMRLHNLKPPPHCSLRAVRSAAASGTAPIRSVVLPAQPLAALS